MSSIKKSEFKDSEDKQKNYRNFLYLAHEKDVKLEFTADLLSDNCLGNDSNSHLIIFLICMALKKDFSCIFIRTVLHKKLLSRTYCYYQILKKENNDLGFIYIGLRDASKALNHLGDSRSSDTNLKPVKLVNVSTL